MPSNKNNPHNNGVYNSNTSQVIEPCMLEDDKRKVIAFHFAKIMDSLGLNRNDPSLQETPNRVAKMYVNEVFKGLDSSNFPKVTLFENTSGYDEMIMVDRIALYSYCEHHFVPFFGEATIAYIPKDHVIGLSKINRIVQFIASKPQIQEKLTTEIGQKFNEILQTQDVAVFIKAHHLCVASRGVEDNRSVTRTSFFGGKFRKEKMKTKFFDAMDKI